jgi:hypothetical protein
MTAGAMVLLLAAGCSSGGDDSSTSTTATTTTLPPATTTTTVDPRTATEVDVCRLVSDRELATVLDDAGPGVPTLTQPEAEGVPALLSGRCDWPDREHSKLTLYYLGPTTAESGQQHLQDVMAQEPEVFEGGTVLPPVTVGAEEVSFLADADGNLREGAVVARSALVYLVINEDVSAREPENAQRYGELLVAALVRAPR